MEWQPIATAPETDYNEAPRSVIVWGPQLGVRTGRACVRPDGWVFADVSNVNGNIAGSLVTHWMPLPEAPK